MSRPVVSKKLKLLNLTFNVVLSIAMAIMVSASTNSQGGGIENFGWGGGQGQGSGYNSGFGSGYASGYGSG